MQEVLARTHGVREDESAVRMRTATAVAALARLAADAGAGLAQDALAGAARENAQALRLAVGALVAFDEEVACRLHDRALQVIEYVATDGYGAGLTHERVVELLCEAAYEATRALHSGRRSTDLMAELRASVEDGGRMGLPPVRLVGRVDDELNGEDVEAVAGAVHEALTNVRRHAHAQCVELRVTQRRRELRVVVADDGVGADRSRLAGATGLGLRRSVGRRVARRGGWSNVRTAPGAGTRVELSLTLAEVA